MSTADRLRFSCARRLWEKSRRGWPSEATCARPRCACKRNSLILPYMPKDGLWRMSSKHTDNSCGMPATAVSVLGQITAAHLPLVKAACCEHEEAQL